jgi:hypothetical protein
MSLNPDQQLARIRELADLADRTTDTADLDRFTDAFRALDAHLSAGGIPPEAWGMSAANEGPDAPDYTDYRTEWPEDGWREATPEETAAYLSGHWTTGLLMRESEGEGVEVHDA